MNDTGQISSSDYRRQLAQLREALLGLHKTLVDSERISYEQNIGTIPSASHFLRPLTDDPWFAWAARRFISAPGARWAGCRFRRARANSS
jgi:hypothetical protein